MPAWYELRTYHCMPGRLPAVLDRFSNAVMKLSRAPRLPARWLLDRVDR